MCMSLLQFEQQIRFLNSKADFFHIDIMDGHYVPALALSPNFISQAATLATRPIDAHLMLEKPTQFVEEVIRSGASIISIHPETISTEAFRLTRIINELGARMGIVLNPVTNVGAAEYYLDIASKVTVMTVDPGFAGQKFISAMLTKIETLKNMKEKHGYAYLIEADGSCNMTTFKGLVNAGTEVFVVGYSGLFDLDPDISNAWQMMEENFSKAL
jgi:D-allulose-6-phosphate 3-epimerase